MYGNSNPSNSVVLDNAVDDVEAFNLYYDREPGENVGKYEINVTATNANYNIYYVYGELTISTATLTITPESGQSKVYGVDTDLTYSVSGLKNYDTEEIIFGDLGVDNEKVGVTTIIINTLNAGENYEIVLVEDVMISVTPKTISAVAVREYEYTGADFIPEFDLIGVVGSDDVSVITTTTLLNVGDYSVTLELLGDDSDNYELESSTISVEVNKMTILLDDIYEEDYTNNSKTIYSKEDILGIIGWSEDKQWLKDYLNEIELPNGATTISYNISIPGNDNVNELNQTITIKFKSVTIGNNSVYYTIEDALDEASSGQTIIVKYNTSFAESTVAQSVYGTTTFEVKSGVILLVPFSSGYSTGLAQFNNNVVNSSNRIPYSELIIPSNLELVINGTLTVNATRSTGSGTQFMGFTDYSNFSQLRIDAESIIKVYGNLNVIGYIYGDGEVEALGSASIQETLFIKSFRGGTVTSGIYNTVFPFNQFTANNIETTLILNSGVTYDALTVVSVSLPIIGLTYNNGSIPLLGPNNTYLIQLTSGRMVKSYDAETGEVNLDIQGNANFNPVNVTISVSASSRDKDIPFDGTWNFKISSGSTLTIKDGARIGFLPGSSVVVEEGATVVIENGAKISIVPTGTINDSPVYPNNYSNFYRTKPPTNFDRFTPAEALINGEIIVRSGGSLAGEIQLLENGVLTLESGALTSHKYRYVTGTSGSTIGEIDIAPYISNTTYEKGFNELGEEVVIISETFKYNNGNPVEGLEVKFTSSIGEFTAITDEHGIATIMIPFDPSWEEYSTISFEISYTSLTGLYYKKAYEFVHQLFILTAVGPTGNISSDGGSTSINVTLVDGYTNLPLESINVTINSTDNWITVPTGPFITNANGNVTINNITIASKSNSGTRTGYVDVSVTYRGVIKEQRVTIVQNGTSGSPYLYSVDSEGNLHFEHEPISHSMLKTVESTTYGTLRLLQGIDGKYYIEVIEEGDSITMLNGANIFYFDYEFDSEIIDFFIDVYGNPHTIKDRIAPTSFVDHYGNSYLNEVLQKDGNFAQFDPNIQDPLGYFIATFNRPNSNNAKFMITVKDNSGTMDAMNQILASINAQQNLWWLDRAFMGSQESKQSIQNIFDSLLIRVEVWNGTEWVYQGDIQRGSYLLEEFLIELNLENIHTEDLQVRLSLPTQAGYIIDSIAVDYSENVPITSGVMTLETAILNGMIDVYDLVSDSYDGLYASLDFQDAVRMGFSAPELAEGYTRSFGVNMSGYIYAAGIQVEDELEELMIGKSFEEIKQIIIDSGRTELIADIPMIEEFYYTIVYLGSLELEYILDFLFNQLE